MQKPTSLPYSSQSRGKRSSWPQSWMTTLPSFVQSRHVLPVASSTASWHSSCAASHVLETTKPLASVHVSHVSLPSLTSGELGSTGDGSHVMPSPWMPSLHESKSTRWSSVVHTEHVSPDVTFSRVSQRATSGAPQIDTSALTVPSAATAFSSLHDAHTLRAPFASVVESMASTLHPGVAIAATGDAPTSSPPSCLSAGTSHVPPASPARSQQPAAPIDVASVATTRVARARVDDGIR